jgi:hypothetical protein
MASGFVPSSGLEVNNLGECVGDVCETPKSYCAEVSVFGNATISYIGFDSKKYFTTLINQTIFICAWEGSITKISGTGTVTITQDTTGSTCSSNSECIIEDFIMVAAGLTTVTFSNFKSSQPFTIVWGDGNTTTYAADPATGIVTHTYSTPYTGNIIIRSSNLTSITEFEIATPGNIVPSTTGNATTPSSFPLHINGSEITKLDGLIKLVLTQNVLLNDTTTAQLPRTLENITVSWADVLGTIANLPDAIPVAKTGQLILGNFTSVSGNLSTMPASYRVISVSGTNTISGNISSLQGHVVSFAVLGSNTLTGNVAGIPNSYTSGSVGSSVLTSVNIQGLNTLSGNIREFNIENIRFLSITGDAPGGNVLGGSIDATVSDTRLWNTVTTPGLSFTLLQVLGKNTISGDLSTLTNCTRLSRISIDGKLSPSLGNTLTGDLSDLPVTGGAGVNNVMDRLILAGANTITGSLTDISNFSVLRTITLTGSSLITGTLSDLPTSTYSLNIEGQSNIGTYPTQREKGTANAYNLSRFAVRPFTPLTGSLSAADLSQLLIDLDIVVTTLASRTWEKSESGIVPANISLYGDFANITAPAVAALASLNTKIVTTGIGAIVTIQVP